MNLKQVKKCFYCSFLIFLGSLTFFLVSWLLPPRDAVCDRQSLIFTPLQEVIGYKWINYADYFFPRSVFRTSQKRPIAPETEQAWRDLEHVFEVSIPDQKLGALNQSTDYQWKRRPDGGIAANIAVFHQLSCLSSIRRHAEADLGDPGRQASRERVDQCIELLRHKFMCDADTTPFLLRYDSEAIRGNTPDIGTKHKCRNYNAVVTWSRQNGG